MSGTTEPYVVVVDDEQPIVDVVVDVLADSGITAVGCAHGDRAFPCIERVQPRLVILDIQMPGMDGIQVYHQLQAHPLFQRIPVIFFTANSHLLQERLPDYEQRGVKLLPKPFNLTKLLAMVDQSLAA